jgi:hypothetical protein
MNEAELAGVFASLTYFKNEIYHLEYVGGPLHIVLDDFNLRDDDLAYSWNYLAETQNDWLLAVQHASRAVLGLLAQLTYAQRIIWRRGGSAREALEKRDWVQNETNEGGLDTELMPPLGGELHDHGSSGT